MFIEHVGIPTLPAVRQAVEALQDLDMHRKVQLVVSGGIRSGADVAKALALGADRGLDRLGRDGGAGLQSAGPCRGLRAIGAEPGVCHHCHTGLCPVGITTQEEALEAAARSARGARWLRNYLSAMVLELQTLARASGKSHVLNLEPEDMVALTVEAAAMAGVPLAGTDWIPGRDHTG